MLLADQIFVSFLNLIERENSIDEGMDLAGLQQTIHVFEAKKRDTTQI